MTSQQVKMDLTIIGFDSNRQVVPQTIEYRDGRVVSFDQFVKDHSEMNSDMTTENVIVSYFAMRKFDLQELVVESSNHTEWGKMTWIKNHPSYTRNDYHFPEVLLPYLNAMFHLANGQVVSHSLLSCGDGGFLHKSLIYHKVVFSSRNK